MREIAMLKGRVALTLAVATVAGSLAYAAEKRSPLEGCWELHSNKGIAEGKEYSLPGNVSGSQLKCYSKGHFLFVGQLTFEGAPRANYGGGSYSLKGEDYTETLIYHVASGAVGQTLRFKLVVKGETMTLTGPLDASGQKTLGNSFMEVYARKD
jgi:hypothetical protein